MATKINFQRLSAVVLASVRVLTEKVRTSTRTMKILRILACVAVFTLVLGVYTSAIRSDQKRKDTAIYEKMIAEYRAEQIAAAEEATRAAAENPYQLQLNADGELLARVLYGVKDNKTEDLRTYCWCVFNRVDNPAFPSTIEEVISQPSQWMRYADDNPVLENLYLIARAELDAWHTSHRPCTSDFVYMNWSPSDIVLRDAWKEGSGTHYWRISQ